MNIHLNNPSPSLLSPFRESHHYYGRSDFRSAVLHGSQGTEIPSSVIEPRFKSCRLYNGGHMASNQVTAILFSASFATCDFAQQLCDFVTSSAIHLHSSLKSIPDGYSAFSQSVHHSSFTAFAALGGLITPPEQRYRYFSLNLWPVSSHLQHILAIQLTKISRHKQRRRAAKKLWCARFDFRRLCGLASIPKCFRFQKNLPCLHKENSLDYSCGKKANHRTRYNWRSRPIN